MKTLFASVFMENKEYENALMVGLCRECPGIRLSVVSTHEEAAESGINGILLTDADIYGSLVLKKEDMKGIPLKEILRKMISLYFDMTGEIFSSVEDDNPVLLEFYSHFGGNGVTSIAIATARVLAASSEGRVIYLNLCRYDDYEFYVDVDFGDLSSKRKFIYKIKKRSKLFPMYEFIREDQWGVWYFRPQTGRNSFENECDAAMIISWLLEYKDISYIVADSYGGYCESGMQIEVISSRDFRNMNKLKKGLAVYNFSEYNFSDDGNDDFHVPEDNESFIVKGDKIELSMTGKFLSSVENIVKYIKRKKEI